MEAIPILAAAALAWLFTRKRPPADPTDPAVIPDYEPTYKRPASLPRPTAKPPALTVEKPSVSVDNPFRNFSPEMVDFPDGSPPAVTLRIPDASRYTKPVISAVSDTVELAADAVPKQLIETTVDTAKTVTNKAVEVAERVRLPDVVKNAGRSLQDVATSNSARAGNAAKSVIGALQPQWVLSLLPDVVKSAAANLATNAAANLGAKAVLSAAGTIAGSFVTAWRAKDTTKQIAAVITGWTDPTKRDWRKTTTKFIDQWKFTPGMDWSLIAGYDGPKSPTLYSFLDSSPNGISEGSYELTVAAVNEKLPMLTVEEAAQFVIDAITVEVYRCSTFEPKKIDGKTYLGQNAAEKEHQAELYAAFREKWRPILGERK